MPQDVLIIDDSPAIHALIKARLKDEPIVLHSATCGEAGLKMAAAVQPDLILLDVDMPAPDGFEVCRRLKRDETLLHVPVIFLTGASATPEKLRGLEVGAVDHITKPFDPAELRARVRAALRMKFMIDLLASKAQLDALTGLWNRRYFEERFEAELSLAKRDHRPLSVVMLDLDGFKAINDKFGHPGGDELLQRVASLLIECVRNEDIVCRYGGEEFALICPNVGVGAAGLAERLRATIERAHFVAGGREASITASFGVAASGENADACLIEHADAALFRAKEAGRNRVELAGTEFMVGVGERSDEMS